MDETIKLIVETDAGAVYHDEQNDEWLVDVASKGITLYFDNDDFLEFLEMMKQTLTGTEFSIRDQRPISPN